MDRVIDLVRAANRDVFDFDITDFAESPQVARYGAEREGHFGWHSDVGEGRLAERRKLTIVVQLYEPDAYTGGDLEVMPGANIISADRARGTATLFPSFVLHRVTPVTVGERHSLTVWCHGAPFRYGSLAPLCKIEQDACGGAELRTVGRRSICRFR